MQLTAKQITEFQNQIWEYFKAHKRDLPWRVFNKNGELDPYHILVSEIMLQQTQVSRVIPKYEEFLRVFPSVHSLATASLSEVLALWSGLGYNRRARFLHEAGMQIANEYNGLVPKKVEQLVKLSGVGVNTAAAILAYSFNTPVVFIETNIRSVYLHHFFSGKSGIADTELLKLVEETLPRENSREWYWALMDYGSYLKQALPNPSRASKHHSAQPKFEGSRRQIRGAVLKALVTNPSSLATLQSSIQDERLESVLSDLASEGLVRKQSKIYHLGK